MVVQSLTFPGCLEMNVSVKFVNRHLLFAAQSSTYLPLIMHFEYTFIHLKFYSQDAKRNFRKQRVKKQTYMWNLESVDVDIHIDIAAEIYIKIMTMTDINKTNTKRQRAKSGDGL